jgi:putative transposase
VNDFSFIASEKLASQEMAEERYGKSINDAGWNMFTNMLAYKAEGAGCKVVFVDPKNTTQECSRCGSITEKILQNRIHNCPYCRLVMDRDLNAACVILKRATWARGSNASGNVAVAASLKEEAHTYS